MIETSRPPPALRWLAPTPVPGPPRQLRPSPCRALAAHALWCVGGVVVWLCFGASAGAQEPQQGPGEGASMVAVNAPATVPAPVGPSGAITPAVRPGSSAVPDAVPATPANALALSGALPASARVDASMGPRVLACTVCHGKEGRSTPDGYFPRIAGKPAGYLASQLVNFREGRRSYPQMTYLLEHLTDDYLHEMAAYFSALELPYPAPLAAQAPQAALARGRALVQHGDAARKIPACVACHGARMTGVAPSIPGLLGLPRDYLNGQLGAWKTGQRRSHAPDCMADVARQLSPQDVSDISAWLAAQPVPEGGKPAERLPAPLPQRCAGVDGAALLDSVTQGGGAAPAAAAIAVQKAPAAVAPSRADQGARL